MSVILFFQVKFNMEFTSGSECFLNHIAKATGAKPNVFYFCEHFLILLSVSAYAARFRNLFVYFFLLSDFTPVNRLKQQAVAG